VQAEKFMLDLIRAVLKCRSKCRSKCI